MNTTHDQQQNDVAPVMGASLLSPSLEIQLKAERVQEAESLAAGPTEAFVYGLSIQPVQPVTITVTGTTAIFTLYGPDGNASPGEAS